MARRTRRKLRGGQDKFSPLARKLTTHQYYSRTVPPEMRKAVTDADTALRNVDKFEQRTTSPAARAELQATRDRIMRRVRPEMRTSVAKAEAAKESLRKEYGRGRRTRRHK